jgi:hypothetical protein
MGRFVFGVMIPDLLVSFLFAGTATALCKVYGQADEDFA